ncbi:MAG: hypothetical protein PVG70_00200 [Desulfobacterales bacterium]|jgi:hypothetical protein
MGSNYYRYDSKTTNFWIPPLVNFRDGVDIATLFTPRESRRTSDSALLRARSPADSRDDFTLSRLDSEALRLLQRWGKERLIAAW